jgi:membrane associated rhomboid family serine protease
MTNQWLLLKREKSKGFDTQEEVCKALKNWSPFSPVLIAKPQSNQFLPPTCHQELAPKIVMAHKARVRVCLVMVVVATLISFVGMVIYNNSIFLKGFALFLLIAVATFSDYFISFKSLFVMSERTKFFYWVFNSKLMKQVTLGWLMFIATLAIFQLLFEFFLGGREPLFNFIGTVHAPIINGEIWRLFTGPFLHSSPAHFLMNAVFLIIIGPLSWCFFSYRSALILILGSSIGALVSTLSGTFIDNYPYDSYAGLSSGIFALFGVIFMSGLMNKKLLPPGIALHLGFIATISIVSASVYTQHSANASHWAGFMFGVILSIWLRAEEIVLTEVDLLDFDCL